jgi:Peptidase inhibitor family I36
MRQTLSVLLERKTLLAALAALALVASALFIAASQASASLGQCLENQVCVWQTKNFEGKFSHWSGSETGCKAHLENLEIRSGWNNTGFNVRFGGKFTLGGGGKFELGSGEVITGQICW